jgi:phosphoglycolate phosphatase-like HAD superfamily hydrolase
MLKTLNMTDPRAALESFKPQHEFYVGIDSDGCTFDTMELKHKECFIPNIIKYYGLQSVSKYAREAAEFINLYSEWRGVNRFPALVLTLDLLKDWPTVKRRRVLLANTTRLEKFVNSGRPLGNPSLKEEIAAGSHPELELALKWSEAVNRDIADMVHGVSPFPYVRECLEKVSGFADQMCVSATPLAALTAEWKEHDLAKHVCVIVGQEVASKKDALAVAAKAGYAQGKILMVGDAPGDMKAARANGALFYPVVPGEEEKSWELLHEEALGRFKEGTYGGDYEKNLIDNFLKKLPSIPPWKQ